MSLLLPGFVLALSLVTLSLMVATMVMREPALAAGGVGTVHPFSPNPGTAAADTRADLTALTVTPGPLPAVRPWQVRSLSSLRDVESFLDQLEVHGCGEREVLSLGTKSFAVRWR
jgi:hypothetical protein